MAAPAIWQSKPVVQAIIHDITERKQMEELKDRFISAVTHELRTPLVSIKGYTDYLLTGKLGSLSPKVESSIRTVKDASDRLLDLTNNLLDYRRLALGKFELNPEPIDMKDIVKTCIREIHPTIENKSQRLEVQVGEESLPVNGDRTRLIQVVMNLLDNATKFTGENGKVTLRVGREAGFAKLVVSDNGIGIKDDDLARVFEPFAAIQKPSHIPGTGLGLSVAKGLVEAHGGNFRAESAGLGKGATFTIMIPLRKE